MTGRLEVTFEPRRRHDVRHQLGLFSIDYFTLHGRYSGVIRGQDRSWDVQDVHGVAERMVARL